MMWRWIHERARLRVCPMEDVKKTESWMERRPAGKKATSRILMTMTRETIFIKPITYITTALLSSLKKMNISEKQLPVIAGAGLAVATLLWMHKKKTTTEATCSTHDKCVLITGCDSGFGELLAHRAIDAGYTVVAACYTAKGATNLKQTTNAVTVIADLTTKKGRRMVVEAAKTTCESMGGLYAIVNNAGVVIPGNVDWLQPKAYEDSMSLNFHAPVELTYELLPLLKRKRGRVINVTSVDGFITLPTNSAYNASKHALESWSDCLRCEMLPWGVKVVVIEPSTMKTPLALSYADNYRATFQAAAPDRQAQYGEGWIEKVHDATTKGILDAAMPPEETADDLMRALRLSDPPTRIASGAAAKYIFKPLSWLSDNVRDRVLFKLIIAGQPIPEALAVPRPPVNKISHVSIRVTNLQKALEFYQQFGFKVVGQAFGGQQFLKSGEHTCWKPLLLLVEDPGMQPRQNSYDIGMTRLCLYTENVDKDVQDLSARGLEPMYPIANDTLAKIAAYKDPDNFVIYIIQFKHVIGLICKYFRYKYDITYPWMFHWTINVKDSTKVNAMFEKIGFKPLSDQNKNQVGEGLLPAFGLKGEDTVIEHIRLANLPNDHFEATTMEWVRPESKKTGHELSNSMCISVDNVELALKEAKDAGMLIQGKTRKTTLPFYGEVQVGTAFLEENSNRVDFIAF